MGGRNLIISSNGFVRNRNHCQYYFRIREKLGELVVRMLNISNECIDYATVDMLCSLMQPLHQNYELKLEQLNKQSLLATPQFVEHLLDLVVRHVVINFKNLILVDFLPMDQPYMTLNQFRGLP